MSLLLVLRPQPGAAATAARAAALGHVCVVAPMFETSALAWEAPDLDSFEAVMMTSANAARLGGEALGSFTSLPLYAVGLATAAAARQAGFRHIIAGDGDGTAVLALAERDGVERLLHLAGREHRAVAAAGLRVVRRIVYASDAATVLPAAARDALSCGATVLLHSPRAAALFAGLAPEPSAIRISCLSSAVADAAGSGWRAVAVADGPTDDALLAAAAGLCDHATQ